MRYRRGDELGAARDRVGNGQRAARIREHRHGWPGVDLAQLAVEHER
jgi:hypothetical protein